jgi:hypothetical protein
MKKLILPIVFLLFSTFAYAQTLPIDFESGITTSDFVDFDGGTGTVIANPQANGINTSDSVGQIVRNGGQIWAGSKIVFPNNFDFSTNNVMSMKVYMTAPIGTTVKLKFESSMGAVEKDALTTVTGAWETLTWDFTGAPNTFNEIVFMFDFGNTGDGSATSTFLFDDVEQVFGGAQIDLPVTFEGSTVNYTTTDFGGTVSSLVTDPTNMSNHVMQVIKTDSATTWAGTTIGTSGGFANNIPLTLMDSKMSVRVWSPDANIPVRLKVEDSNDPTHTCETEATTTMAGSWEVLVFDFANEAPGTAALSFGLNAGWAYNMASIFFNFGTDGPTAGEKTYYFDDVAFGTGFTSISPLFEVEGVDVFPNPAQTHWKISSTKAPIKQIELFDLQGKRLLFIKRITDHVIIHANEFADGVYIAKVHTDLGIKTLKLMK